MSIILFIVFINSVVWLLAPIRQFRTKYFTFFLILGLLDPVYISGYYLFKLNLGIVFLIGTGILTFGATVNFSLKHRIIIFIIITLLGLVAAIFFKAYYIYVELFIHLFIFFNFLTILLKEFSENRQLPHFSILLIAYEVSLLVKFYLTLNHQEIAAAYFHFTSIIQIIIGIFFLFINEKNSRSIKFT